MRCFKIFTPATYIPSNWGELVGMCHLMLKLPTNSENVVQLLHKNSDISFNSLLALTKLKPSSVPTKWLKTFMIKVPHCQHLPWRRVRWVAPELIVSHPWKVEFFTTISGEYYTTTQHNKFSCKILFLNQSKQFCNIRKKWCSRLCICLRCS